MVASERYGTRCSSTGAAGFSLEQRKAFGLLRGSPGLRTSKIVVSDTSSTAFASIDEFSSFLESGGASNPEARFGRLSQYGQRCRDAGFARYVR